MWRRRCGSRWYRRAQRHSPGQLTPRCCHSTLASEAPADGPQRMAQLPAAVSFAQVGETTFRPLSTTKMLPDWYLHLGRQAISAARRYLHTARKDLSPAPNDVSPGRNVLQNCRSYGALGHFNVVDFGRLTSWLVVSKPVVLNKVRWRICRTKRAHRRAFLDGLEKLSRSGPAIWRDATGTRLYTWDGLHGEIEVFTMRGHHLGALDAVSGALIKRPVKGRRLHV